MNLFVQKEENNRELGKNRNSDKKKKRNEKKTYHCDS